VWQFSQPLALAWIVWGWAGVMSIARGHHDIGFFFDHISQGVAPGREDKSILFFMVISELLVGQ